MQNPIMNYSKFPSSEINHLINLCYLLFNNDNHSEDERVRFREIIERITSEIIDTSDNEFDSYPFIHPSLEDKRESILSNSSLLHR